MALLDVNWKPDHRALRQFSALFLIFIGGIGFFLFWRPGISEFVPWILWITAAIFGFGGLAYPPLSLPAYRTLVAISLPIGFVVSFLLLSVVYYLIVTPTGLLMRTLGYDPMNRRFDVAAKTYWMKRTQKRDAKSYFRQF